MSTVFSAIVRHFGVWCFSTYTELRTSSSFLALIADNNFECAPNRHFVRKFRKHASAILGKSIGRSQDFAIHDYCIDHVTRRYFCKICTHVPVEKRFLQRYLVRDKRESEVDLEKLAQAANSKLFVDHNEIVETQSEETSGAGLEALKNNKICQKLTKKVFNMSFMSCTLINTANFINIKV